MSRLKERLYCIPMQMERSFCTGRAGRSMYNNLFYRRMIDREIARSGLQAGAHVLHIGAGAAPFTAAGLSEAGFRVTAVDCCPNAVCKAREFMNSWCSDAAEPCSRHIDFCLSAGETQDYSSYDAIWISLHVPQAPEIIQKVRSQHPDAVIVWRTPANWLSWAYSPSDFPEADSIRHFWGNRSHIISNSSDTALTELRKGDSAVCSSVPQHSDLPSLSIRPGKTLTYLGKAAFHGPCIVCIGTRRIAICPQLAAHIRVRREIA